MSDDNFSIDQFAEPVPVAGVVPFWAKFLIWLFRCVILLLLLLTFRQPDWLALLFIFAVPFVVCEIVLLIALFRRRWILPADNGFIYSSRFGSEMVEQDSIDGYSIQIKELPREIHFFGKQHTKIRRCFTLWITGRHKPLVLKYTSRSDKPDPLFGFIMQTSNALNRRFELQIENGETVEGKNWSLEGNVLHYETKTETDSITLADIGSVEVLGNTLQIWQRGSQEACLSIPVDTKNVFWLTGYLNKNIEPDDVPSEGLGKFLFGKKRTSGWIHFITGTVLIAGMIAVPLLVPVQNPDDNLFVIIGEIIAGLIVIALPFMWLNCRGLRFYEYGLTVSYPRWSREIPFEDIETFQWYRTDQYVNGGYAGTIFTFLLFLVPEAGLKKLILTYNNQKGEEGGYETFRQKLTEYLAERMQDELSVKNRVNWIDSKGSCIYLTDAAVVFEKSKRGTVIETTVLPYNQIAAAGMTTAKEPIFGIVHKDGEQGLQFSTGNVNFFPCLLLFERVMRKEMFWMSAVDSSIKIEEE
ncbi:MAG: hypothetical protein LBN39_10825 [Planctomycetaceae bacterium]|jgi:hypothetical protein|nr:hypothetical protein [Planctomycetaceae bacterium]